MKRYGKLAVIGLVCMFCAGVAFSAVYEDLDLNRWSVRGTQVTATATELNTVGAGGSNGVVMYPQIRNGSATNLALKGKSIATGWTATNGTLENFVLSAPIVSAPSVTGGSLTNPTLTGASVCTGWTATNGTLTGFAINAPTITGGSSTSITLKGSILCTGATFTNGTLTGFTINGWTLTNMTVMTDSVTTNAAKNFVIAP